MKNVMIGLILGIIIGGVAGYLFMSSAKQTAYDQGVSEGTKKGTAEGIKTGMAQGMAEAQAQQTRAHDSLMQAQKLAAAKKKTEHVPVKKAEPIQNWHVYGGKIEDPVIDSAKASRREIR